MSRGPRTAPSGIIRAQFLLCDFRRVCRSPSLYMIGKVKKKRASSAMTLVRLVTLMFRAPNELWDKGQSSWTPPVKKSPMRM